ncbi:DUF3800 domain-containing protein [Haloferax chudinovii]|uniref:DUF3800 domain-containing protein n=1 Tax=Haloferax chudinovii TaxID=1109010 RepID=A0ABD5XFI5_9EURY
MSETLYIFVDESGQYAQGSHYVVAGCWCVSSSRPGNVFQNAVSQLVESLTTSYGYGGTVNELKGTSLPTEHLGELLRNLEQYSYNDGTVGHDGTTWNHARPFACTYHHLNPTVGTELLADYLPRPDAPQALQTLALAKILNPLHHRARIDLSDIDTIRLVPDAEVWNTPASRVSSALQQHGQLEIPDIEVNTRDSAKTPGIQVSDMMAYSLRTNYKSGNCQSAERFLSEIQC